MIDKPTFVHKPTFVPFPPELTPVRIVKRRNRFAVEARMDIRNHNDEGPVGPDNPLGGVRESGPMESSSAQCLLLHLPNSGRMQELLVPGTRALAALDGGGARKTDGTLLLVHYNERWVSVDSRMPNKLFERCLVDGWLPAFREYDHWRAEVSWRKGRIDFMLTSSDEGVPAFLVETKSCNLVEDGLALFPDAPTERGARHLRELIEAIEDGYRSAVVWFVQRDDATRLAPYKEADPAFADAVADARAAGVDLYAYRCRVSPEGIEVLDEIPVVDPIPVVGPDTTSRNA